MHDGKALQAGTSHNFGTNFAEAYNIQFSEQGRQAGIRPRDQLGRVHPSDRRDHHDPRRRARPEAAALRVAPIQVVIVPIAAAQGRRAGDVRRGCRRSWRPQASA